MTNKRHHKDQDSAYRKRSLFGRRQGRALRGQRYEAMQNTLPKIEIPKDILREDHSTCPTSLFKQPFDSYFLEIGFGHGERLSEHSASNQDIAFLGAEPFINGMADFVKNIKEECLNNTRVIMDDGMILAYSLKPHSLDAIYILNPDPWHKKRHHKRRIVNQHNLDVCAKILKPGGTLVLTSDVPDMIEWMCIHANFHPAFEWKAQKEEDWSEPPENWISTRYEEKGAKGADKMAYLFFERKPE